MGGACAFIRKSAPGQVSSTRCESSLRRNVHPTGSSRAAAATAAAARQRTDPASEASP